MDFKVGDKVLFNSKPCFWAREAGVKAGTTYVVVGRHISPNVILNTNLSYSVSTAPLALVLENNNE